MKFLKYIKSLLLVWLLVAGAQEAIGQTFTVTGGTTSNVNITSADFTCTNTTQLVQNAPGLLNDKPITITSNVPITSISFTMSTLGGTFGEVEKHKFDALGITNEVVTVPSCSGYLTVSGNQVSNPVGNVKNVMSKITVTSVTPFTQVTISIVAGYAALLASNTFEAVPLCNAGITASPTLSATTISNTCPATTVDLSTITASNTPTNSTLTWHTATPASNANKIATADLATSPAGTYYAAFYDATNDCYTNAGAGTTAVTATVALCPLNISNTCDSFSVDLSASLQGSVPTGYTLTFHSGTPATAANKLSSSKVNTSGTYYGSYYFAAQDCYTGTGRPLVVTIINCCEIQGAPDFN